MKGAAVNAALRESLDRSKRKTAEGKPLTVAVLREALRNEHPPRVAHRRP